MTKQAKQLRVSETDKEDKVLAVSEKKSVAALKLYRPAKTQESVCREYGIEPDKVIKLAGNESRFGCSPKVIEA